MLSKIQIFQVISCKKLSLFADSLRTIRSTSNSCIISCLTNFIADVSSRSSSNIQSRIEPTLEEIRTVISEFCQLNPDLLVLAAPPMYRLKPEWYRDNLSEILLQFSKVMSPLRSRNFHLLPTFSGIDLEDDRVHLTPYSGLKFVVHLFDSSLDVIKSMTEPVPEKLSRVGEAARVLEDRVSVLEQDHRLMRQEFSLKIARDSELADFEENSRNECYFVISGLPPVPSELVGRQWQDYAKGMVQGKIRVILGRESRIIVVSGLRRDENPVFLVKLESVSDSKMIRDKFGSFFKAGAPPVPPELKGLSIRIRLTHASRVRISIMQALASNYKSSNPGSKVQVVNYEPRPLLRLTPPQNATDPRVMNFFFIDAVTKLPTRFSKKDLSMIMKATSGKFKGQLRSLFVVISDDLRDLGSNPRNAVVPAVAAPGTPHSTSSRSSSSGSSSESESEHESAPVGVTELTVTRRSSSQMETDRLVSPSSTARNTAEPEVSGSQTQPPSGRGSKRGPPSEKKSKSKARR